MQITKFKIKNFRSYGDVEQVISFNQGLNFIVGPNGSGKTNIIRALQLLSHCIKNGAITSDNLDPDIYLELSLRLSPEEITLIGTIIAKSLYVQIKSLTSQENFAKTRNLIFKPIINPLIDELTIEEINRLVSKLLDEGLITEQEQTGYLGQPNIDSKQSFILNLVKETNFQEFSSFLIAQYDIKQNRFGIFQSEVILQNFYDALLLDQLHKDIGQLFRDFRVELSADLESTKINFLTNSPTYSLKIENTELSYNKRENIPRRDLIDFLNESSSVIINSIKFNFITSLLDDITNTSDSWILNIPTINIYKGEGQLKTLSKKILDLLDNLSLLNKNVQTVGIEKIIQLLYQNSIYLIPEHRGLLPNLKQGIEYITLPDMKNKLFSWKNSSYPTLRRKYYQLREDFQKIFGMDFDIKVEEVPLEVESPDPIIVLGEISSSSTSFNVPSEEVQDQKVLKVSKNTTNLRIVQPSIQFLSEENKVPLEIEDAPSGAYETLLLLTTLFETGSKIILIDEPGRALHPQLQRRIINSIKNYIGSQSPTFILITHSPYFIRDIEDTSIWKCIGRGQIRQFDLTQLKDSFQSNVSRYINQIENITALLFAHQVIFVEGPYDELFLKVLETNFKIFDLEGDRWDIIQLGGKSNYPLARALTNILELNHIAILDFDTAFDQQYKSQHGEYNTFKSSVLGKIVNEDKNFHELAKYNEFTAESIRGEKKLGELHEKLKKHSIFLLEEGRLEEVVWSISGKDENKNKKVRIEDIYSCIESIKDINDHKNITKFARFVKGKSKLKPKKLEDKIK